jgi:uncharacterized protein
MPFQPSRLGPGAVYLRSLDSLFWSNADLIRVAEVEPQSLWTKGTKPDSLPRGSPLERRRLSTLPQRRLIHGVGYPIGGTVCDQERHIGEFRLWTEELSCPWVSEHLSILDVHGSGGLQPCGFLMPPLQTDAQVELAAGNIIRRTAVLGRPFAFETGVSYFVRRDCEMPDGDFFAEVADAADCGILLDFTNLWVNHKNGRAKISEVLARIPLERVWEVHLAGMEFAYGHWLDAHCGAIDPDLVEIAAEFLPSLPNLGAIIFELAPDRVSLFGEKAFLHQIETLHRLWETTRSLSASTVPVSARPPLTELPGPTPEAWERLIADRMLPAADRPPNVVPIEIVPIEIRTADEQSFSLYARLAASFRAGAIAELLENTTRLLLMGIGEEALRDLLDRYISVTPPVAFPTDEAIRFRRFMDANPLPVPGLEDMLRFESALVEAAADSTTIQVTLAKDIDAMLTDLAAGRLPGPSSDCPPTVIEIGVDPGPFIRIPEEQLETALSS